jgi:hypothetical protein
VIIALIAFIAVVIAVVAYVFVRGSTRPTLDEQAFNDAYDELATKGEVDGRERDAAWSDFRDWQTRNEADRRSWEDADDD